MHESLFQKAKTINPNLTEQEFEAKRAEALSRAGEAHDLVDVGGGVMMDTSSLDNDQKESILEDRRDESHD